MKKNLPKVRYGLRNGVFMIKLLLAGLSVFTLQARDSAQDVTIIGENVMVQEVLTDIEEQTGMKFFYNNDQIDTDRRVSLDLSQIPLNEALNVVFKGTNVAYKFSGDYIVLTERAAHPKERELTLKGGDDGVEENVHVGHSLESMRPSDPIIVSGKVLDENGEPLPGVSVVLKGRAMGTLTSVSGNYRIQADESDTLVFTFVGYSPYEVAVNGRSVIDIGMGVSIYSLQEVVVLNDGSNGYMDLPKERTTGSFSVISAKEIENVPAMSLMEKLEGKIPGVYFNTKTNAIQVRGTNNYAQSPPLIVIDGFPMEQSFELTEGGQTSSVLNYINPQDIENITVLKDAAASSIWGSRAANGVIVITTKKGKKAEPRISLSSTFTMGGDQRLKYLDEMNSSEYVDFERDLVNGGFLSDPSGNWMSQNISSAQQLLFAEQRGEITESQLDLALNELSSRNSRDQVKKYLLQRALNQQYNFSVSGGGVDQSYFFSANYSKDQPIYKKNQSESYSLNFNHNVSFFSERIQLKTGINYVTTEDQQNKAAIEALSPNGSYALRPYDMLKGEDGNPAEYALLFNDQVTDSLQDLGYLPWRYNAMEELNYSNIVSTNNNVRINAALKTHITNWLELELSGMFMKSVSDLNSLSEEDSYFSRNLINQATSYDVNTGKLVYGVPLGGYLYTQNGKKKSYDLRSQLNYSDNFGIDHQVNVIAGAEIREENNIGYSQTRYGYDENTSSSQAVNPTEYYTTVYGWSSNIGYNDGSLNRYRNRYLSYYSNGSYGYKSKYFVSGSVRFDDFNLLGASRRDRALPLWSAGVKWNMTLEPFMKSVKWLTMLSPRITYGKSGSAPSGGFGNSSAIISVGGVNGSTQLPVTDISSPENDRLKWETTRQWNFGLDYGLFNNRIGGSMEVYFKKSSDILAAVPYNATYGYSFLEYNTGSLEGHGVELGLTAVLVDGKNWNWTSTFNFAYNTNKVTDSRYEEQTVSGLLGGGAPLTGRPTDYLYAHKWAGLNELGQSQVYDENGEILSSTDYDVNPEALRYMGRRTPPYQGGLFQSINYKSLSLNVQMTYYMGHKLRKKLLRNYPTYQGTYYGVVGRQSQIADRWRNPGDEQLTDVPGLPNIDYNSVNRYNMSDLRVISADHIRLQQISLAYEFPTKWLGKAVVKGIRLNASARNLGVLWAKNKDGLDPQYLGGNSYADLPPSRNYSMMLQITL